MVERRVPKWSEVRPLLAVRPPFTGPSAVDRAASIEDLRRIAKRRTPRSVFDYVDGAAGQELSLARSRDAFSRVEFRPHVLNDVAQIDTS